MLTEGQACCLVLGKPPTEENRKEAKQIFADSPFGVTYLYGTNPMEPVAMGKDVIKQNPFKYKSYNATPPPSPELSPATDTTDVEETLVLDDNATTSTRSSQEVIINYSKANVIKTAKMLFTSKEPASKEYFRHRFLTNKDIYDALQNQFPKLKQHFSFQQIANWINAERDYFGLLTTHKVQKVPKKGRWLWTGSEAVTSVLSENNAAFRSHCKNAHREWINVGYVRKSRTNENDEKRVKLLKLMMARLVNRCLCTKLFASPASSSSTNMVERDYPKPNTILEQLNGCDGDTQDLLAYLATCTKKVRLCIIDYAGLSNDPDDVKKFVKNNKNIKEVVVDHSNTIELLDRYKLLNDKKQIAKFKSRPGPVKRSKV